MSGGGMKSLLVHVLAVLVTVVSPQPGRAEAGAGLQESVCLQCHGAQPGRLGAPVGLWRGSVHAGNGVSCHDCHGGDPTDLANAMSPDRGFLGVPTVEQIPAFCGRCHVGVQDDYLASAHGRALTRGGAQCVTCHGNHRVEQASLALINAKDCSRCHEFGRADEIRSSMAAVDEGIQRLDARISTLRRIGVATKPIAAELFALRNDYHRLFHSVEIERVRLESAQFAQRLNQVEHKLVALEDELLWRRQIGAGVVGLLLLAGILLLLVRKTYQEEEGAG